MYSILMSDIWWLDGSPEEQKLKGRGSLDEISICQHD